MNYPQKTFGNKHEWASKKVKVILTDPEGALTLKNFDSQPDKLALMMSVFPSVLPLSGKRTLKRLQMLKEQGLVCPDGDNFWEWYVFSRKTRVATLNQDFNTMYRYLQQAGFYSKTFKQTFLNFRLKQRDGVRKGDTVLTEEEVACVLRKTYDLSHPPNLVKQRALDMFILSLFTGARVEDVKNMVKSTDSRGNPIILFHNRKGTRSQSIAWLDVMEGPISRGLYKEDKQPNRIALREALYEALPSSSNRLVTYYYLRPGQGRELRTDSRIMHMGFHTARHTFCTRLLRKGVSPSIVAQLAGHKSIQTTMKYYNWTQEDEANDVLRDVYAENVVVSTRQEWGETGKVKPMPAKIHAAQTIKGSDGLPDNGTFNEYLKRSKGKCKLTAKQRAWQEKMKRMGIV